MSNTRRTNKAVRAGRVIVRELEEVKIVDRRGNVKVSMQPVRKDPPATTETPRRNQKHARWKSPSPGASGSNHSTIPYFQRSRASKVCILYIY
jgi:hypothetical protein